MKRFSEISKAALSREVIYGVTHRAHDPWYIALNEWWTDHHKITDKEKDYFYSSLGLLVRAGLKFTKALRLIVKRARSERMKRIVRTIAYDMENKGMSFSSAMSKYPQVFETSEVKMVYSGEVTGNLEQTLDAIADQIQKNLHLRMQVRSALMYPLVVVAAIIGAIIIVVQLVVPGLAGMFYEFGADLPFFTKVLLGLSGFTTRYWWLVLALLVIGWGMFNGWKNTREGRRIWDKWWLTAPLLAPIINNIQTVRIAGNLSTLLMSGVPVPKALHILGEMVSSSVVSDSLFNVEYRVIKGDRLFACFQEDENFDEVLGEVIEVGEKGGQVPEVLKRTAEQYQMELDSQLKNLMTILEPVIILVVGAAVALLAIAILVPMLQLTTLFSTG